MELPKQLFKYQPPSIQALTNLSAAKIWFSHPGKFNDPFDCALESIFEEFSEDELASALGVFEPRPDLKKVIQNMPPEEVRKALLEGLKGAVAMGVDQIGGVCCLSAVVDDMLMWGHYADSHRGFCLEFDTAFRPFSKAHCVRYSQTLPRLKIEKVLQNDIQQLMELVLTKAAFWQYESEWRMFHYTADQIFAYERRALTGVYFGAKMPDDQRLMISSMLANTDTKLYEMKPSKASFALEKQVVTFTRIDYRDQRPGGDSGPAVKAS